MGILQKLCCGKPQDAVAAPPPSTPRPSTDAVADFMAQLQRQQAGAATPFSRTPPGRPDTPRPPVSGTGGRPITPPPLPRPRRHRYENTTATV